jgi:hypothetical protein
MIYDWIVRTSSDDEAVSRGQIAAKVAILYRLMLKRSRWNVTGTTGEVEALNWASAWGNRGEMEQALYLVSRRFLMGREQALGVWRSF